ncbi:MAG: hypothetical protein PVH30_12940 [Desulfobacterales bacterium]|jgi:C4-dicarboxylate-specific signal transduction histidine kinase
MGTTDTGESTGLQFFGKIAAAVTHDLKNSLSVINESAGLLEDFCVMAQHGQSIDMGRIGKVAGQVKGQVERADRIIRSFNRFAHCVDHPVAPTDMGETVATLVQLAQRLLAGAGLSAAVRLPEPPVVIATRPLLAQVMIWSGIQWAAGCVGDSNEMPIVVEASAGGASVRIGPLADLTGVGQGSDLLASTTGVREVLNAELSVETASRTLVMQFAALNAP